MHDTGRCRFFFFFYFYFASTSFFSMPRQEGRTFFFKGRTKEFVIHVGLARAKPPTSGHSHLSFNRKVLRGARASVLKATILPSFDTSYAFTARILKQRSAARMIAAITCAIIRALTLLSSFPFYLYRHLSLTATLIPSPFLKYDRCTRLCKLCKKY